MEIFELAKLLGEAIAKDSRMIEFDKAKATYENDAELQAALKEKGIPTMVYYPKPMHTQKAFELDENYEFDCANTTELCGNVLSLPMHPYLKDEEIDEVVAAVKDFLK